MFDGNPINLSPTHVFTAANALEGGAFTAVKLTENGIETANSGDIVAGIVSTEYTLPVVKDTEVTVVLRGNCLWFAGEDIKAGDFLTVGDKGVAVKATSGKFIFARALGNGKADTAIEIQILNGGFAA